MAKLTDIEKRIRRSARDKDKKPSSQPPQHLFKTPKAPPTPKNMADLGAAAVATMIKAKSTGDQVTTLAKALDEMRDLVYCSLAIADTARRALEARVAELEARLGIESPIPEQTITDEQIPDDEIPDDEIPNDATAEA